MLAADVVYRAGYGVTGCVGGTRYLLGSARHTGGAPGLADLAHALYLANDDGPVARFLLADRIRPQAREALELLAGDKILVSGDAPAAVAETAARLGIAHHCASQAPDDKLALLRAAQKDGRVVGAVGDGINDAPLLAQADVSIAMVEGSRLAQATADVVFTGEDLRVLARLPAFAAATRRIVRQNLVWAVGYNLVAVPLAASGVLTPWLAAIGMSLSSLIVVGNALRLSRAFGVRGRARAPAQAAAPRDTVSDAAPLLEEAA
jgi:Cu2+-exporting ATPase